MSRKPPSSAEQSKILFLLLRERPDALARSLAATPAAVHHRLLGTDLPLHIAVRRNRADMARICIEAGAKVDALGKQGFTALQIASGLGHLSCARVLLHAGAEVDCRGPEGLTALHAAAHGGHTAVARALLEAGAHPAPGPVGEDTPECLARRNRHSDTAELLDLWPCANALRARLSTPHPTPASAPDPSL